MTFFQNKSLFLNCYFIISQSPLTQSHCKGDSETLPAIAQTDEPCQCHCFTFKVSCWPWGVLGPILTNRHLPQTPLTATQSLCGCESAQVCRQDKQGLLHPWDLEIWRQEVHLLNTLLPGRHKGAQAWERPQPFPVSPPPLPMTLASCKAYSCTRGWESELQVA